MYTPRDLGRVAYEEYRKQRTAIHTTAWDKLTPQNRRVWEAVEVAVGKDLDAMKQFVEARIRELKLALGEVASIRSSIRKKRANSALETHSTASAHKL